MKTVTVSRKWLESEIFITVNVTDDEISLTMPLDDFVKSIAAKISHDAAARATMASPLSTRKTIARLLQDSIAPDVIVYAAQVVNEMKQASVAGVS